jgi:hypothetical protein
MPAAVIAVENSPCPELTMAAIRTGISDDDPLAEAALGELPPQAARARARAAATASRGILRMGNTDCSPVGFVERVLAG